MTRVAGDGGAYRPLQDPLSGAMCRIPGDTAGDFALSSPLFTVLYNDAAAHGLTRGAVGAHSDPFGDAYGVQL
jgi:hypothetical protein